MDKLRALISWTALLLVSGSMMVTAHAQTQSKIIMSFYSSTHPHHYPADYTSVITIYDDGKGYFCHGVYCPYYECLPPDYTQLSPQQLEWVKSRIASIRSRQVQTGTAISVNHDVTYSSFGSRLYVQTQADEKLMLRQYTNLKGYYDESEHFKATLDVSWIADPAVDEIIEYVNQNSPAKLELDPELIHVTGFWRL